MNENSLRKKEIYTGLFGLLFFFGVFFVGEFGLRVLNEIRFGGTEVLGETASESNQSEFIAERTGFFSDQFGLRRPYPNQMIGQVRINNHGFRGPDIPFENPEGNLRLAFIGSSTTYDAAVSEGSNWPSQVVQILENRLQSCRIDYVNAGLPGFSTPNMRVYWNEVVKGFAPNVVIVLPGDMTPDLQKAAKEAGFDNQSTDTSWLMRNSVLWALIAKNAEVVRLQSTAFSESQKFNPDRSSLTQGFRGNLGGLLDSILADEVFVAVPTIASHVRSDMPEQRQLIAADSALYYLPYISIPTLIEMQDAYNDTLRSVVSEYEAVLLIDGDERIPADNLHFVDSRHFAAQGSRAMAERVVDSLLVSSEFQAVIKSRGGCEITAR